MTSTARLSGEELARVRDGRIRENKRARVEDNMLVDVDESYSRKRSGEL